ncbi:ADP-ribosylation factor-like protein 2-binding protein [Erpetoichthys calabaricus]|uniref:ADP-ribosylation factor-like protein 2-binding protein n=1 Tax=Erpetoichthys calabaricus TaxID=27687 RepID=A0A8C4RG26_ERPCA|nr:ADP-ribosylation factor-like protein 2-binding protein [Erpetoichthys calabaricus]
MAAIETSEGEDVGKEEFLALSFSGSDATFDTIIGYIEHVIVDDKFQQLQRNFMEHYYLEFEETEENNLNYAALFKEYKEQLGKYIEEQLVARMPGFSMEGFTSSLEKHKEKITEEIFEMLLSFKNFLAFKKMILDYRAEKEGRGLNLEGGLVVTALSAPASRSEGP